MPTRNENYIICPKELKQSLLRQYPVAPCLIGLYDHNFLIISKRTVNILPVYPGINFLLENDLICSRFFNKDLQGLEQNFVHDYKNNYFHIVLDINKKIMLKKLFRCTNANIFLIKFVLESV
jgi:hypothetical protein